MPAPDLPRLFADAEAAEDDAEQVVGRELARDLRQRVAGEAQLLGEEVQHRVAPRGMRRRGAQVLARPLERLDLARAGEDQVLARGVALPPGEAFQLRAQQVDAGAALRR